jgi:hypothetical protein
MPRPWTRPGGTLRLPLALLLAAVVLAGCTPDQPAGPVLPGPAPAPPTTQSLAAMCGPKPFGAAQPEHAGWVRFYVTPQQMDVISSRLLEVHCRQGLWRQGVGFGTNVDPQGRRFVMIHPGRSGLTARQVLDRFLGRVP